MSADQHSKTNTLNLIPIELCGIIFYPRIVAFLVSMPGSHHSFFSDGPELRQLQNLATYCQIGWFLAKFNIIQSQFIDLGLWSVSLPLVLLLIPQYGGEVLECIRNTWICQHEGGVKGGMILISELGSFLPTRKTNLNCPSGHTKSNRQVWSL